MYIGWVVAYLLANFVRGVFCQVVEKLLITAVGFCEFAVTSCTADARLMKHLNICLQLRKSVANIT